MIQILSEDFGTVGTVPQEAIEALWGAYPWPVFFTIISIATFSLCLTALFFIFGLGFPGRSSSLLALALICFFGVASLVGFVKSPDRVDPTAVEALREYLPEEYALSREDAIELITAGPNEKFTLPAGLAVSMNARTGNADFVVVDHNYETAPNVSRGNQISKIIALSSLSVLTLSFAMLALSSIFAWPQHPRKWKLNARKKVNPSRQLISQDARSPMLGYKKAWLVNPLAKQPFLGVSGVSSRYGWVDTAQDEDHGFHAYSSLNSALAHNQKGNVYLEVLLSGTLNQHELGGESSRQRVLQVIIGKCETCESKQATRWLVQTVKSNSTISFQCDQCVSTSQVDSRSLDELESLLRFSSLESQSWLFSTLESVEERPSWTPTLLTDSPKI